MAEKITVDGDNDASRQTLSICDQLIFDEILPRLPVKLLIRFKLVSKRWNSAISNLEFAKLHLKFISSNHKNRRFIIAPRIKDFNRKKRYCDFYFMLPSYIERYCLLPYNERSNVKDDLVLLDEQVAEFRKGDLLAMVDSCNGLVCLYQQLLHDDSDVESRRCFFTLWNPATCEHKDIPSPEGVRVSKAYGFGYVSSVDDYFIVASFRDGPGYSHGGNGTITKSLGLYLLSLKAGKWEKILGRFDYLHTTREWKSVRDPSYEENVVDRLFGAAVMVGDIMFWAPENVVGGFYGFDLVTKELKLHLMRSWPSGYLNLGPFQIKGCLSLLFHSWRNRHVFQLWTMKHPSDSDHSWQKTLSVDLKNTCLLTFSETGKCLVQQLEEFKLVDLCKEALEVTERKCAIDMHKLHNNVIAKDHVESLISPFAIT